MIKSADKLRPGETGTVTALGSKGELRRRIIDMGITPGAVITMRGAAPLGDPLELSVRGYELSLRRGEASSISVEVLP